MCPPSLLSAQLTRLADEVGGISNFFSFIRTGIERPGRRKKLMETLFYFDLHIFHNK